MTNYNCKLCRRQLTEVQASYFTVCLSCADDHLKTSAKTIKKPVILNTRGLRYRIAPLYVKIYKNGISRRFRRVLGGVSI